MLIHQNLFVSLVDQISDAHPPETCLSLSLYPNAQCFCSQMSKRSTTILTLFPLILVDLNVNNDEPSLPVILFPQNNFIYLGPNENWHPSPHQLLLLEQKFTVKNALGRTEAKDFATEIMAYGTHFISAMCHKFYTFEGEIGAGRIYKNHIPLLLKGDIEGRFLDVLFQNLIWENVLGVGILEAANRELYKPEDLAKEITTQAKPVNRIGFIGLGAMGFGMAEHLLKSNFSVRSTLHYEFSRESMVYKPTLVRFVSIGGLAANSPADVTKDVDVLVIMVTNEVQKVAEDTAENLHRTCRVLIEDSKGADSGGVSGGDDA